MQSTLNINYKLKQWNKFILKLVNRAYLIHTYNLRDDYKDGSLITLSFRSGNHYYKSQVNVINISKHTM